MRIPECSICLTLMLITIVVNQLERVNVLNRRKRTAYTGQNWLTWAIPGVSKYSKIRAINVFIKTRPLGQI